MGAVTIPKEVIFEALEAKGFGESIKVIRKHDPLYLISAEDGTPLQAFEVSVHVDFEKTFIVHAPSKDDAEDLLEDYDIRDDLCWSDFDVSARLSKSDKTPDFVWEPPQ